ncbi:RHS repeat-associated core domain-containing protein [Stenotrophomonas maltophilia]|uniref:RHS repeat-associated core domain-containing protein n=1 Tax=Stenotrophomonas maltophilia TaxID=40324 RepID=UPI003D7D94E2
MRSMVIGLVVAICSATYALESKADTVTYIHTDALGSVVAESDETGRVTKRYSYEPYGAPIGTNIEDGVGYAGHVSDSATGLSYMQQRYYDPDLGRFLSVDPVTMYGNGDWRHFNAYAYGFNSPYTFKDPDGRCPICPALFGAAGGMAVDYGIQKYMNPGKPINKTELAIAGVAGVITGGTGGLAVGALARGTISIGQVVAIQATVGAATGVAGTAAQGAIEGTPVTSAQLGLSAVGGSVGSLAGSGIGKLAGDFSQASTQGAVSNMMKAPVSSPAGIGAHIAEATASAGAIGAKQGAVQGALSNAGQRGADAAVGTGQKIAEDRLKR